MFELQHGQHPGLAASIWCHIGSGLFLLCDFGGEILLLEEIGGEIFLREEFGGERFLPIGAGKGFLSCSLEDLSLENLSPGVLLLGNRSIAACFI